ncbi:MAG: M23 family metallopeptidase [Bacteroidota bacterium]|jgi:murein DD-endopeptidase MepM/ murein hydrolase activator NlpD|nr:M23 family metallopeptidase [Bacteroidota bacterium]|tara:strand:+ start:215 stop:1192 length:978 start_codon:yes stop_codon:yes gene_type:complete
MAKIKYHFDSETLSYVPVESSRTVKISRLLIFFISSFLFGGIILFVLLNTSIVNTPQELLLKREVENYKLQFELINRRIVQMESVLNNIEDRDNNIYRVYFEASPIPEEQRKAGFGGVNRYKDLEGFDNSNLIINTTKKIDILTKQLVIQSKSLDEILSLAEEKENLLASIPSIQPIQNKDLKRMASGYGWRIDPFTKKRRRHFGMDFSAVRGTPVYATGNGIIKRVDNRAAGFGKHIRIDHGFGYVSIYAHLDKYNVKRGQKVKRGQIIGFVGNTGRSVAPHLHYEIVKDGKKINPINFYYGNLSPDEFNILVQQASQENESLD